MDIASLNSTLNQTVNSISNLNMSQIDYKTWVNVTQSTPFIISILVIVLVPLIIYIIAGCIIEGSGKKKMIEFPNFWVAVMIYLFIQGSLLLMIIFPIWLNFINP